MLITQSRSTNRYGLLVLGVILSSMVIMGLQGRWEANLPKQAAAEGSPYHDPWAWHGVACLSKLNLQDPMVPFEVSIVHLPGQERSIVDQAIQELPEQNATKDGEPYSDTMMERYLIIRTACRDTWKDVYEKWGFAGHAAARQLLPSNRTPTEAEYRNAVLRLRFPKQFDVADRLFPHKAEILSTMPDQP